MHALLHGLDDPGGRYGMIRLQVRNPARVLAIVTAHEIGHSLGLHHTDRSEGTSIMHPSALIRPWDNPRFTPANVARLRARLPGIGRGLGSAHQTPHGGATCAPGACHLHRPPGAPALHDR